MIWCDTMKKMTFHTNPKKNVMEELRRLKVDPTLLDGSAHIHRDKSGKVTITYGSTTEVLEVASQGSKIDKIWIEPKLQNKSTSFKKNQRRGGSKARKIRKERQRKARLTHEKQLKRKKSRVQKNRLEKDKLFGVLMSTDYSYNSLVNEYISQNKDDPRILENDYMSTWIDDTRIGEVDEELDLELLKHMNHSEYRHVLNSFLTAFGRNPDMKDMNNILSSLKRWRKNIPFNHKLYNTMVTTLHEEEKAMKTNFYEAILHWDKAFYDIPIFKKKGRPLIDNISLSYHQAEQHNDVLYCLIESNIITNETMLLIYLYSLNLSHLYSEVAVKELIVDGRFIDIKFHSTGVFNPKLIKKQFESMWEALDALGKARLYEEEDVGHALMCWVRDKILSAVQAVLNEQPIFPDKEIIPPMLWVLSNLWAIPYQLYQPFLIDVLKMSRRWDTKAETKKTESQDLLRTITMRPFWRWDEDSKKMLYPDTMTTPRDFLHDVLVTRLFEQYSAHDYYVAGSKSAYRTDHLQIHLPTSTENMQRYIHSPAPFINRLQGRVNCPYLERTKNAMNFVIDPDTKQLIINTGLPTKIRSEFLYLPYESMFLDVNLPLPSGDMCEGILIHELNDEQYAEYVEKGHGDHVFCNLITGEETTDVAQASDSLVTVPIGQEFDEYINEQWIKKIDTVRQHSSIHAHGIKRLVADTNFFGSEHYGIDISYDTPTIPTLSVLMDAGVITTPLYPNKRHWVISSIINNGKERYVTTERIGVSTWDNEFPTRPKKTGKTKDMREILDFIIGLLYFIQLPDVTFVDKQEKKDTKHIRKREEKRKKAGRPLWAKTKVIQLSGEVKRYVNSIALGEGNGRRFHRVRRHFRVLKADRYKEQGKVVWVKSHERGWGGNDNQEYEVKR